MNLQGRLAVFLVLLAVLVGCSSDFGDKAYFRLLDRAIKYFEKGDLYMAERGFSRATRDSRKPEGYFWLGRVKELTTPSREDEIRLYKKTIEISPGFADAYNRLAFALIGGGRFSEARSYLVKQAEKTTWAMDVYGNIAYTYFWDGDYELAEVNYKKALALDEQYTFGLNGLAMIYSVTKRYNEAKELLQKSLSIDGGYSNRGVYADFAKLEEMQGHYPAAREYWKKFLAFKNLPPEDKAEAMKALERLHKNTKGSTP